MYYNNPNDPWLRHDDYQDKNLTEQEQVNRGCIQAVVYFIAFVIGILICSLFSSCRSTEYVIMETVRTDTTYITKHQHDSIYRYDSIYVSEKGDTVHIERWHTKYIEHDVHDTTYINKTDSVPAPYPVTEYVEKQLTWWQQTRIHLANIVLWLLLIVGIIYIGRRHLKKYLP